MHRRPKTFIASLFILISLPLALGVCCCLNDVLASIFSSPQQHQHAHHHAVNHHEHGNHDHGECEHDQLIANIPSMASLSLQLPVAFSFLKSYVFDILSFEQVDAQKTFFDTGPPGYHFSKTPLYLQISVLRI